MRDVGAEGGEARGDRLAVADVGEEAPEHRQTAPGADRRHDPALRQRGGEPHRLEQHGLAAGVGAADEQRALVRRSARGRTEPPAPRRASSSGWRPFTIRSDAGRAAHLGHLARARRPRSARGRPDRPPRRTSRPRPRIAGSSGRSRSVSSRSTLSVSRSSSTSASRSALPSSIASVGSMKRVPALPDSSCMMPAGRLRESRRTGMT